MVRDDWVSIGIQKGTVKKIDEFLKTHNAKDFGIKNRQQFVGRIVTEFLESGMEIFQKGKEVKKLTTELNTATNMLNMLGKGLMGVNDMENLKHEKIATDKIIIRDKSIKKSVSVVVKEDTPYCTYHNAAWCNHIAYVFYLTMMSAFQTKLKNK